MDEHVVDYLADPNPYEPIWMSPNDLLEVSVAWSFGTPFPLYSDFPLAHSDLNPSVPSLSFTTLFIASPCLDWPPLSLATLHLLTTFIPRSPSYDSLPLVSSSHQVSTTFPTSVGFVSALGFSSL